MVAEPLKGHPALVEAILSATQKTEPEIFAQRKRVTDLKQIMALGVMITPALAVNGTIKVVGKVPSVAELKTILLQAA